MTDWMTRALGDDPNPFRALPNGQPYQPGPMSNRQAIEMGMGAASGGMISSDVKGMLGRSTRGFPAGGFAVGAAPAVLDEMERYGLTYGGQDIPDYFDRQATADLAKGSTNSLLAARTAAGAAMMGQAAMLPPYGPHTIADLALMGLLTAGTGFLGSAATRNFERRDGNLAARDMWRNTDMPQLPTPSTRSGVRNFLTESAAVPAAGRVHNALSAARATTERP